MLTRNEGPGASLNNKISSFDKRRLPPRVFIRLVSLVIVYDVSRMEFLNNSPPYNQTRDSIYRDRI